MSSGAWKWSDVDVAVPLSQLPGVRMAGFRTKAPVHVEIAMVVHPSVTLFVDLSAGQGLVYDDGGRRHRGSIVAGLLPGGLRMGGTVGECLQIRLEPAVAAAVLGASSELCGTVVSLEDIWGREAMRVEDRLRATTSWDSRFAIATETLGRRMDRGRPTDPEVARAWQCATLSRGRVRVDGLAEEVGWTRKRLWSRFQAQLGISPKQAARLVRFDHAAHLLAAGRPAARVAADCGYVDQSHLYRDVRDFAGLTPTAVAVAPWLGIDHRAWPASPG